MREIKRITILQNIFDCFQRVAQWNPWQLNHCVSYMHEAEALIKLLEVHDCGSVGGFDNENPLIKSKCWKLYRRFVTLLKKYDDEKRIKSSCDFTPKSMEQYYIEVEGLREKIQNQSVRSAKKRKKK